MAIKWINKIETEGYATLSSNYVVINQSFADKFTTSYKALLGVDENDNILLKPLSLDEAESPLYKDKMLLKVSVFSSFVRIGNTASMKTIGELIGEELNKNGKKYSTTWDEKEKALTIRTGGK